MFTNSMANIVCTYLPYNINNCINMVHNFLLDSRFVSELGVGLLGICELVVSSRQIGGRRFATSANNGSPIHFGKLFDFVDDGSGYDSLSERIHRALVFSILPLPYSSNHASFTY